MCLNLISAYLVVFISSIFLNSSTNSVSGKIIKKVSLPPVSTFEKNCSRCHGSEGKNFGPEFGKLENNELRKVIEDMMYGPGFLKPNEYDIEAMFHYIISLRENKLFLCVLNYDKYIEGKDKILNVESSLNTVLYANPEFKLQNKGNLWEIKMISNAGNNIVFRLVRGEKEEYISLQEGFWAK